MDDFCPTPRGTIRAAWRWAGVVIAGVILLAALIFGGWQAGWWFQAQNIQHQSNNIRASYATQEAYVQQVSGYIGSIDGITTQEATASGQQLADLQAQALGIGNQACQVAAQISIPSSDSQWISANCSAGAVSLTSPLRKGTQ